MTVLVILIILIILIIIIIMSFVLLPIVFPISLAVKITRIVAHAVIVLIIIITRQ